MAKALNIGVTPWAPLGGGLLTGKYLEKGKGRLEKEHPRRSEKNLKIAKKVVDIAKELNVSPGNVAINWCRQQNQQVIPIVGASKASQMKENLACLDFKIPEEQMKQLDEVSKIDLGFPHEFLKSEMVKNVTFGGTYGQFDWD